MSFGGTGMTRRVRCVAVSNAAIAVLLAACSASAPAPAASPTEPPAWAGNLKAFPITGAEDHIFISGTVGSTPGATLVGADTPFGRADLTATSGCIGGGPEPMSQWRIDAHGSISLVLGSGYLAVWKASGLPDEGSTMPVTLRFSDAADVIVFADVQPVEREDTPAPRAAAARAEAVSSPDRGLAGLGKTRGCIAIIGAVRRPRVPAPTDRAGRRRAELAPAARPRLASQSRTCCWL